MKQRPDDVYGEYYRLIGDVDLNEPAKVEWLLQVFGQKVLQGAPTLVRVRAMPQDDVKFEDFWKALIAMPHNVYLG